MSSSPADANRAALEPPYGLRWAGAADDNAAATLLLNAFSHLYARTGVEMSPARRAYLGDQASRRSFARTLLQEVHGKLVGTVTLVPPSAESEAWLDGAWDLRLLAIAPDAQGRGLAKTLMREAERHVQAASAPAMCLHARRGVAVQSRFYPSCGYARDPAGDLDVEPYQEGYVKRF